MRQTSTPEEQQIRHKYNRTAVARERVRARFALKIVQVVTRAYNKRTATGF